jgi:FkbM family methyltransferase
MKYFIDLGAYNGDTLKKAVSLYSDFDSFIGFEPVGKLYKKAVSRFKNNPKVKIHRKAASVKYGSDKIFVHITKKGNGKGSSLHLKKKTGNLKKTQYEKIKTIDFAEYITKNFKKNDTIILKIDIEGEEYSLLSHMIDSGAIEYIDKIYCEWHNDKIDMVADEHDSLLSKLNELGFNLHGKNPKDDFDKINS